MGSFHGSSCPTFLWLRAVFLGLQHGSLASDVSSSGGHCVSPVGTAGDRVGLDAGGLTAAGWAPQQCPCGFSGGVGVLYGGRC